MNLKDAQAEAKKAREKIEAARQRISTDERAITDARERASQAEEACRRADQPDGPGFEKLVLARSTADARVQALEDRLQRSKKGLEDAIADGSRAHAVEIEADLAEAKREAAQADAELLAFVRAAREGARERLARLERALRRANAADIELSDLRGDPIPSYLLPRHYNTCTSLIVASTEKNILEHLEPLVDDKAHGNRRGIQNCQAVQAAMPKSGQEG